MATQADAKLMMQILQWSTEAGAMDGMLTLLSPAFDPESAKVEDRAVFLNLMMGETIGTFVKQGLLDKDLVTDLWAPGIIWERVGPAALRQRDEYGVPALWENFELLAKG
jgi:hypothetical protein